MATVYAILSLRKSSERSFVGKREKERERERDSGREKKERERRIERKKEIEAAPWL